MSDLDPSESDSSEEEETDNSNLLVDETAGKNVPQAIALDDDVFSIAFHTIKDNVIAIGEITGQVSLYNYSLEENKKLLSFNFHKKACRSLFFNKDGTKLYTSSKDKSIHTIDLNTGCLIHDISKAHDKAVNCIESLGDNFFASGSDDGVVKLWDSRTYTSVAVFDDNKDYISDMTSDKEKKHLLCTSGDGLLSVFNVRKRKLEALSDQLDEELLSIAIVKDGKKVICGSGDGTLNIYSWGEWGDMSDRIPSDNNSIDALCKINEDLIGTGADDSHIRCLSIQPHQALGVLGKHGNLGIQSLKLSPDQKYIASSAGEPTVRFWNISEYVDENSADDANSQQKKTNRKRKLDPVQNKADGFFDDL